MERHVVPFDAERVDEDRREPFPDIEAPVVERNLRGTAEVCVVHGEDGTAEVLDCGYFIVSGAVADASSSATTLTRTVSCQLISRLSSSSSNRWGVTWRVEMA